MVTVLGLLGGCRRFLDSCRRCSLCAGTGGRRGRGSCRCCSWDGGAGGRRGRGSCRCCSWGGGVGGGRGRGSCRCCSWGGGGGGGRVLGGGGRGASLAGAFGLCLVDADAGSGHLEDHAVVDDAVDGGGSGHRILEDPVPLAEHQVARDDHRASFVALGEEREEDLHFVAVLLDV